ncbi:MAG: QueT transporter family protein [Candidatus Asgardarchaeia archaeon]
MRNKSVYVSLSATFSALYFVLVYIFQPISFAIVQVRVADALIPLSIIFGRPCIIGVSIGAFLSNFYGGFGPIDIVGGTIANFIASYLAYKFKRNKVVATLLASITVSLIVGSYLSFLLMEPIYISIPSIFVGSFISINILGYLLLSILEKSDITSRLEGL